MKLQQVAAAASLLVSHKEGLRESETLNATSSPSNSSYLFDTTTISLPILSAFIAFADQFVFSGIDPLTFSSVSSLMVPHQRYLLLECVQ